MYEIDDCSLLIPFHSVIFSFKNIYATLVSNFQSVWWIETLNENQIFQLCKLCRKMSVGKQYRFFYFEKISKFQ
jgi:hypothetical protein